MWLQIVKRSVLVVGLVVLTVSGGQASRQVQAGEVDMQATLYNQIDPTSLAGVSSTRVTGSFNTFLQAADDFPVPGPEWFIISGVEVRGATAGGASNAVQVEFFQGSGGLPGALLYSQAGAITAGADGNFVLSLPTPAVMRPSAAPYWVSVQAQSSTVTVGWFWFTRSLAPATTASAYKSQSLDGCRNVWAPRSACETTAGAGADNQFALTGFTFIPTAFIYLPLVSR